MKKRLFAGGIAVSIALALYISLTAAASVRQTGNISQASATNASQTGSTNAFQTGKDSLAETAPVLQAGNVSPKPGDSQAPQYDTTINLEADTTLTGSDNQRDTGTTQLINAPATAGSQPQILAAAASQTQAPETDASQTQITTASETREQTSGSAIWSDASEWAIPELIKAMEYNLIPDSLIGADYKLSINRAEFAALSVKLYERLSGLEAVVPAWNPFNDTSDPEILKAYGAGITAGMSDTAYAPEELMNREQAATMLTRVFKAVTISGWTLERDSDFPLAYAAPVPFADDAFISDWARDSVYFMASNGILSGVGLNYFAPKNTTSQEAASGYANAKREQAVAISVRVVDKLGAAPVESGVTPTQSQPSQPAPSTDGAQPGNPSGQTGQSTQEGQSGPNDGSGQTAPQGESGRQPRQDQPTGSPNQTTEPDELPTEPRENTTERMTNAQGQEFFET